MNDRLCNLDLMRGLAALAVCAGHLRGFLFEDFGQVLSPGIFDQLFYLATGLGHQAVIVFFVLSGFLVGGSVLKAHHECRWSWMNYGIRRMSRLWMVLIPALILTLILDSIGQSWLHLGYDGSMGSVYSSGPTLVAPIDLRATTFFGNVFFLQGIEVKSFGTNGPLWSLANEFWYYVLFPLICTIAFTGSLPKRLVCACLAIILITWLPSNLVLMGLIWLFGVAAFWAIQLEKIRIFFRHPIWIIVAGALSMGSLVASKTNSILGTDWSIGIAFALWIGGLASVEHTVGWLKKMSSVLSDISYTLYLVHFPFTFFLFSWVFQGNQFQPNASSYLLFGALLIGITTFSGIVWWCFERNTDLIRKKIELTLSRRK